MNAVHAFTMKRSYQVLFTPEIANKLYNKLRIMTNLLEHAALGLRYDH